MFFTTTIKANFVNTLTSTSTNEDIIIDPNGTGKIELAADVEIDNKLNINGSVITSLETNGSITFTPNGTGGVVLDSIKITENEIAATNTNDDLQLSDEDTINVQLQAKHHFLTEFF